jgi:long-chain acyl-CoA synthetase
MEKRFWHEKYDPKVPPSLDYPPIPLHRFLDDTAAKFPDDTAITFLGKNISYRELLGMADAFAAGLAGMGVKRGDRVALYLPNVPHMIIAYYGTLKAGAICVPTNPLYTERELTHQVKDSGSKVLVTLDLDLTLSKVNAVKDAAGLERIVVGRVSDFLPFPKSLLYPLVKRKDLAPVPRTERYVRFTSLACRPGVAAPAGEVGPADDAVLMYTGGTTGVSKGAILTHANLVANALQTYCWATAGEMDAAPRESAMVILPLFHSFSMTVNMNAGVRRGSRLILFPSKPKPDLSDFLEMIRRERPGLMPGVPVLYTAMANNPEVKKYGVDSIKVCNSGAAPLPVEVLQRFEAVTGAKIIEGYGLSESSPVATCNPLKGERKAGSIGLPVSDTDIRLVDKDDGVTQVKPGEAGEILIKGPQVMRGYWNRPEESAKSLQDGWLYTGDIAWQDPDGYLTIVDRKKDMIITGGFNIFPREVEEVLYEHPKVLEAAVIGVPDPRSGERLKAYVVLKAGETATTEEILAFCRDKLTAYKVPKTLEFRQELPKNNVGKLLRRILREEDARAKDA